MFIESLRLRNAITGELLREVPFHLGANFVIDTEQSEKHNKVGKTTFLKLIDIAMGAKNRKYIYTDVETNSITASLKNFIEANQVSLEVTLVDAFTSSRAKTELKVDLFSKGHYYIDNDQISQANYHKELNILLFGNNKNIPTFRQLINSFVRVSMAGDNNAFLKTLTRASNAVYRSVYNYLFDISDPELDAKLGGLKAGRVSVLEAEKRYKSVVGVDDLSEQEQILLALERSYEEIKAKLDDIVDADDFQENREKISHVRNDYETIMQKISDIRYRLQRNANALDEAKKELERRVDKALSEEFFNEVTALIPSVHRTFNEMIEFNDRLCQNKIDYFENIGQSLEAELHELTHLQEELLRANSRYISLVADDRLDEYDELTSMLYRIQQDIGQRQEIIKTLKGFEQKRRSIDDEIESFSEDNGINDHTCNDFQIEMDLFNTYFTPFATRINGEHPILVYYQDDSKFPVGINDLPGSSTGTRKSLIAAYDLAYQEFARVRQLQVPNFIVHDVVESVEGDNLREIIELSNETNSQYIVAVLKEKLDSSGVSQEEQNELKIIQLSTDNKLFEGQINAAMQPVSLRVQKLRLSA